jgi:hypothetical protein
MHARLWKTIGQFLALGVVATVPVALAAQAASSVKTSPADSASKWDIFAGYSYLAPKGTVQTTTPAGASVSADYKAVNVGGLFSGAYFFNKYVGAQVEFGFHQYGTQQAGNNVGTKGNNDGFTTAATGLIARFPTENITPFIHGLVGGARVGGPYYQPDTWGVDLTAGGGLDYKTPFFGGRLGVRLFQVDYEYMHVDFGPQAQVYGGRANINAARLSTGVVYHIGSIVPPPPVTLALSASPATVYAGEPVTVAATASNLNPKLNAVYNYSGDGVKGNGATATVDTTNLAPGTYTVKGEVKEGKSGKEGLKPGQLASATATYTVKQFEPPTVGVSVSPSTIKPGESAEVTAAGVSPQNRPLTYSYSATAGTISGTGPKATYSSTGAPAGVVTITAKVSDDKGQTATASTDLTIVAPHVEAPRTQALCTIGFSKDKKRPTRVDNEAKACLDEVALGLQRSADAKAVVVGESDAKEKAAIAKQEAAAAKKHHKKAVKIVDPAAQRAANTKEYLVKDKGIDAARVTAATGTTDGKTAENYLVPAGADFASDVKGTTPVTDTVKAQDRKPLGAKKHHKKAAK